MKLIELRRKGINVSLEDGKLKCTAPTGTLTEYVLEQIRVHKPDLIAELRRAKTVGSSVLDMWASDSILHWQAILEESNHRKEYAEWMLKEVLHADG